MANSTPGERHAAGHMANGRQYPPRHDPLPADLRAARRSLGLSFRRAGKRADCHGSTLSDVETGRRAPSVELAGRIVEAYRLNPQASRRLMALAAPRREVPPWRS